MAQENIKSFKHLDTITAFFVAVLIISNVASSKIAQIGPLSLDGGTFLFPLTYIFGDILTIEILFTPITYKLVNFLKKSEQEDYYDKGVLYTLI